jgi:hypothetical protein
VAYEAEKLRLYGLLEQKIGRSLIRNPLLEKEADERALEARNEVGLEADGNDGITHDLDMWEELPAGITTYGENAAWFYFWNDPVAHCAEAWWNSTHHRNNLLNTAFTNWGLGIYTEMPPGQTNELYRRWYFITIFTNNPVVQPEPIPVTPPKGVCPTNLTPIYNRKTTIGEQVNIRTSPKLDSVYIDYMTTKPETHKIVGQVTGDTYNASTSWYVMKEDRGWRYVHRSLCSTPVRIE